MAAVNPYAQMEQNPGMYTGSGYNNGAYGGGTVGGFGAPPGGMPGMETSEDYKRFQENANFDTSPNGPGGGGERVDPENGIAPRRLSDCVCIPIFFLYVLGMVAFCCWASVHGDTTRLTRAFDYRARRCGLDDGVKDKPFLLFCRNFSDLEANNDKAPVGLQMGHGTCVQRCPTKSSDDAVECLTAVLSRTTLGVGGASGPGGVVNSSLFHAEQSLVMARPYESEPANGRYCLPTEVKLKSSLYGWWGPLWIGHRIRTGFGSFQHFPVWGCMFVTCAFTAALSFFYIWVQKYCLKWLMYLSLLASSIALSIGAFFFFIANLAYDFWWDCSKGMNEDETFCKFQRYWDIEPDGWYQKTNPWYLREAQDEAIFYSNITGLVMVCVVIFNWQLYLRTEIKAWQLQDLVMMTYKIAMSMPAIFIVPLIETVVKFFLTLVFVKNFMIILSVGWIDGRRIVVNGVHYEGAEKVFNFDTPFWETVFFLYGCVWCLETVTGFGQYVVSFSVISWWYTPKDPSTGEKIGHHTLQHAPITAVYNGLRYHFGSLLMHGWTVPQWRPARLILKFINLLKPASVERGSYTAQAQGWCSSGLNRMFNCIEYIGFAPLVALLPPLEKVNTYNKDGLSDMVIRSNHWTPSCERADKLYGAHAACKSHRGEMFLVTMISTTSCAMAGTAILFGLLRTDALSNPESATYVQDPPIVLCVSFVLNIMVSYSWIVILDHIPDVLLYTYCHNLRFKRATVDKYMPNELRGLVGGVDKNHDTFAYYGKAKPIQYLGTWMATGANDGVHALPGQQQPPPSSPQQQVRTMGMAGGTMGPPGYTAVPTHGS